MLAATRALRVPSGTASYSATVLADSPTGYWALGDAAGTTATDSSGNSHNGTYTNGPTLGVTGPAPGVTAASFAAASSQYVAPSFIWNPAGAITIEAWINITGAPASAMAICGCSNGLANSTADKILYIDSSGKPFFYCFTNGAGATTSTPASAVPFNAWVYIVGVGDTTNMRLYVNATQVASVAMGPTTFAGYGSNDFYIAANEVTPITLGFFNGKCGQVAIYDHALSSGRVSAHYTAA